MVESYNMGSNPDHDNFSSVLPPLAYLDPEFYAGA